MVSSEVPWTPPPKKRAAVSGGFEVDNREASNRVDRSHSVSKRGQCSRRGESLIDRKRAIFFRLRLPCRPLAEWLHRARCAPSPALAGEGWGGGSLPLWVCGERPPPPPPAPAPPPPHAGGGE